uniref:Ig-like domain-containing protein n=1 Tax=Megaselia scalaris TaxID=36166 RepID=T1GRB4_MEGSC
MDEAVLKGNSGILKCHIPSFVADFIQVISWVDDENREIFSDYGKDDIIKSTDGKYLVLPSENCILEKLDLKMDTKAINVAPSID